MKIEYKKIIKKTVKIVLICFILLYIIPFPVKREINAIEIKLDDPNYIEQRKIQASGYYRFNILRDSTFKGQIIIPEYEFTNYKMDEIQYMKTPGYNGWYYESPVGYKKYKTVILSEAPLYTRNSLDEYYTLGYICSKPLLRNIVICVRGKSKGLKGKDSGWGTDDGYCIVENAETYLEAIEVLKKYHLIPEDF